MSMSTRLQIIVSEEEIEELRKCADREGVTLSEWARRALRRARASQLGPTPELKLKVLEQALQRGHPTSNMDEMLDDIERGRALR